MIAEVYFIQAGKAGPIKIGYSSDVARRIGHLQTSVSELLTVLTTVPGDRRTEHYFHHLMKSHRLTGEWFRPHREVFGLIDKIKSQGVAAIHPDFRMAVMPEGEPTSQDELIEECRDYIMMIGGPRYGSDRIKDMIARVSAASGIGLREVRGIWNRECRALRASTYRTLRELFEATEATRLMRADADENVTNLSVRVRRLAHGE